LEELTMRGGRFPLEDGIVLVIGYGNMLRADDGVGPRVAMAAASWEWPGLTAMAVPQLTPELAEPLAAAELAIFVDARLAGGEGAVEVLPLAPSGSPGRLGHASDPRSLLALSREIYGRSPRSWLVTVPTADLSLGEGLSLIAERGAEEALKRIAALIENDWQHRENPPSTPGIEADGAARIDSAEVIRKSIGLESGY
jgi:hydrogenase maturation protease